MTDITELEWSNYAENLLNAYSVSLSFQINIEHDARSTFYRLSIFDKHSELLDEFTHSDLSFLYALANNLHQKAIHSVKDSYVNLTSDLLEIMLYDSSIID